MIYMCNIQVNPPLIPSLTIPSSKMSKTFNSHVRGGCLILTSTLVPYTVVHTHAIVQYMNQIVQHSGSILRLKWMKCPIHTWGGRVELACSHVPCYTSPVDVYSSDLLIAVVNKRFQWPWCALWVVVRVQSGGPIWLITFFIDCQCLHNHHWIQPPRQGKT